MKSQTLPVKRRPIAKGLFRRLSANTRNRKQRVAAAAATMDEDVEDGSSKISRALIIIFLIHIVAIALIFIHQRFLNGRSGEPVAATTQGAAEAVMVAPAATAREELPRLASGDQPYIVKAGDNYTRIAAAEGVDEANLRLINKHVDISPGLILKIPPKRIVAVDPPEVTAIREQGTQQQVRNAGLVEPVAVNVNNAPRAHPVNVGKTKEDKVKESTPRPTNATGPIGKSYTVQSGDTVWRIASRSKVSVDALMRANGISDARKMKTGMKLVIPQ